MSEIERPRNCGECARMDKFHAIIDGVEYDGGCPEFGTHVRHTDVCHPNVGTKRIGVKKEARQMKQFDKDEFERSLENYRTGWHDIDDPIAEIRRLRGENEDENFEPEQEGGEK